MKAILIDDEKPAIRGLERLINKNYNNIISIVGRYTSFEEAMEGIKKYNPKIVFLDIEMPNTNGLDGAKIIKKLFPETIIIFTTAYEQYAIKAFEVDAMDYLLKPINKDRFDMTIKKVISKLDYYGNYFLLNKNRIHTFDSFQLVINDLTVTFRTSKTKELLAFLVHSNKYIHRDKIIDALWGDEKDKTTASNLLNVTFTYLRKIFKAYDMENTIEHKDNQYRLNCSDIITDFSVFEKAVTHPVDWDTVKSVEEDIKVYTGEYLGQDYFDWAEVKKNEYQAAYKQTLKNLAEFYLSNGYYEKTLQYGSKVLQMDYLDEEAIRDLMKVYMHMGERRSLIALYNNFANKLFDELGVHPEKRTTELFRSLCN